MRLLFKPVVRTGALVVPRKEFTRPPQTPPLPNENGEFVYKVITYQTDVSNIKVKKFVGYDSDIDILPKTMSYCERTARNSETCSQPTVGTSNECKLAGIVIVTNYQTGTTFPHFL